MDCLVASSFFLADYVARKPANLSLRSRYSIRLYAWAKNYVDIGTKKISLEGLREVLGLGPIKDLAGNVIREAPLQIWANFRARALEVAVTEINKKTDLKISIESLEQADYKRVIGVTFGIKAQVMR